MELSNLRPAEGSKHSDNFRRGRGHGSGNGKTAGKGHKGQKARSGWEANMDLLSPDNELDLSDLTWKIYTEDVTALPQYIGTEARIQNAYITQGCVIEGEVTNSVVFTGAKVRPGAKVIDSVLMPGAIVEDGAVVIRALVANGVNIGKGALVGSADSEHIELIAKRVKGAE